MGDELFPTCPRSAPKIVVAECVVEDLRLVEPGRMGRCEPRTPPPAAGSEVVSCSLGGVAGIAVVYQVHAPQVMMATAEFLQLLDVVRRVFRLRACRFHPAVVNNQDVQNVDGPMPGVLELLLFDRAGDRSTDRVAFQGQRPLNLCSSKDFEQVVFVPATASTFHDQTGATGMLLQE